MPAAISVENLSKKYLIRHQKQERYTALRDVIAGNAEALGRKLRGFFSGVDPVAEDDSTSEEFWALKDLSFEVQPGDRVGIIGRNGAGKSTLLKILSRVTEPTSGRVSITGRVASLLEVGTGFHPELTGRENIYLNGAILGMSRHEIMRKFDEIVDFAEVERFLDTPVKRYSSGMYVRLAFAVAAHLEPEILIVDEVLAVGDQEFQKKCLGKMESAGDEGRTLLFVSHNMGVVLGLCHKGILLDGGRAEVFSDVAECVTKYTRLGAETPEDVIPLADRPRPAQSHLRSVARFVAAKMVSKDGWTHWRVPFPQVPVVELSVNVTEPLSNLVLQIALYNSANIEILSSYSSDVILIEDIRLGSLKIVARYDDLILLPGRYSLTLGLRSAFGQEDIVARAITFEISESEESGLIATHHRRGVIVPNMSYEVAGEVRTAARVAQRP